MHYRDIASFETISISLLYDTLSYIDENVNP